MSSSSTVNSGDTDSSSDSNVQETTTSGDTSNILQAIQGCQNAISNVESKVESQTKEIKEDFTKQLSQVSQKLSDMEVSLNFAHKEIETLKQEKGKHESDCKHLKERVEKTQKDNKTLEKKIEGIEKAMEEKTNELESYTRNFSVRVYNVPNLPRNKPPEIYNKIVAELLVHEGLVDGGPRETEEERQKISKEVMKEIETAHPIGARGNQLIVKFHNRPFRNNILKSARAKLSKGEQQLRFTEDLTKMDFELKRKAIPIMHKAFTEGKKCRFRNGKLIVDGQDVKIPE